MFKRIIFIIVFFNSGICSLFASKPLGIHLEPKELYIERSQVWVCVEPKGSSELKLGVIDIYEFYLGNNTTQCSNPKNISSKNKSLNFGFADGAVWVLFDVYSSPAIRENFYLELSYPLLDSIDYFALDTDKNIIKNSVAGDQRPLSAHSIKSHHFVFELPSGPNSSTIALRIKSQGSIPVPLSILPQQLLFKNEADKNMIFGIYYGICLTIILMGFIVYLIYRDSTYSTFMLYIIAYTIFLGNLNGVCRAYLWREFVFMNNSGFLFFFFTSFYFSLAFTSAYLFKYQKTHVLNRLIKINNYMWLILLAMIPFSEYNLLVKIGTFNALLGFLLSISSGIYCSLKGDRSALYYLSSFSVMSIFGIGLTLKSFGLLPHNFITMYGYQSFSLLQILFLSFGIFSKVLQSIKEKEALRTQAIHHKQRSLKNQLEALQAKINPHFLFNTLNTIAEIISKDQILAEKLVVKLSKMYRYILTSSSTHKVQLENEIKMAKLYLSLEKVRLKDRLNYEVHCEGDLSSFVIPGMTLQLLLENAVKHGISPKPSGGTILLKVHVEEGCCLIKVSDDGIGASGNSLGTGTGIENIKKRLDIMFEGKHCFSIDPSNGFHVMIKIPVIGY